MINPKSLENLQKFDKSNASAMGTKGGTNKKGSKHLTTWIDELLNDETFVGQIRDGYQFKEYKGAPLKAILQAQMRLAIAGDVKSADLLFKYGYGTKQEIQHSGEVQTGVVDPKLAAEFSEFLANKTKST